MKHTLKADILFLILVLMHIGVIICFTILKIKGVELALPINQSLLLSQFLILFPAIVYLLVTKTNPFRLIRFNKIDLPTIGMVILLTFLTMPLITFLNVLSMLFSQNAVMALTQEMSGNSFLVNLILMAIIPAISEEFVFRGVLFHTYRKTSVLYGIVVSGVIFGLMHMNFNQFSYAFILGILFALIIEATGSIFATMLAHFIINGNSVVMMASSEWLLKVLGQNSQQLQSEMTPEYLMMAAFVYGLIALGTTAAGIGVYIWIVKHCNREGHMRAVFRIRKGNDRFSIKKTISIPLLLSIVLCISYMIYTETLPNNVIEEQNPKTNTQDSFYDNTLIVELDESSR